MAERRGWTYYAYGGLEPGDHVAYLRFRQGDAELYSTGRGMWVPSDPQRLSRYIERGETALTETTREAIKAALGVALSN